MTDLDVSMNQSVFGIHPADCVHHLGEDGPRRHLVQLSVGGDEIEDIHTVLGPFHHDQETLGAEIAGGQ